MSLIDLYFCCFFFKNGTSTLWWHLSCTGFKHCWSADIWSDNQLFFENLSQIRWFADLSTNVQIYKSDECDKIFSRSFHVHTYMHIMWSDICMYLIIYQLVWQLQLCNMHIHLIFACKMYIHDMWSDNIWQIYTYIIYQLATMYNIHPRFPLLQRSLTAKSLPLTLVTLHPPRQPQHDMIRHMSLFTGHLMQLC